MTLVMAPADTATLWYAAMQSRALPRRIWEVFGRYLGGSGTHLGGIWGACRRYLGVFGMILEVFGG